MTPPPHDAADGVWAERTSSARGGLRRQWLAALAVMLALVVSTGVTALLSAQLVVREFTSTAQGLESAGTFSARLGEAVSTHEGHSHAALGNPARNRDQLLGEQLEVQTIFRQGRALFPHPDMREVLDTAEEQWQASLAEVGLWGPAALSEPAPARDNVHTQLGSATETVLSGLRELDAIARAQLRQDLVEARRSRQLAFNVVAVVVAAALLAMLYFARRMAADVLRPVDALQEGVRRIRAGDLAHRIALPQRPGSSELTELAAGFNEMAAELGASHRELTELAMHDSLTGLPNRLALRERLAGELARRGGSRQRPDVSVLFIDLDDFKLVNDTLGHGGGDELLQQVAERLQRCARADDFVGRLGGDEFALIVCDDSGHGAVLVAERLLQALSAPFVVADTSIGVSASIGIGTTHADPASPEELLGHADFAMYMAKGQGKHRYEIYDPALHAITTDQAVLRNDLRHAVDNDELQLHYQPILDLTDGRLVGVEALLRWNHPLRGSVAPSDFIPMAEQTGAIDEIGVWVLHTATEQLARWRQIPIAKDLWVSVNLSPVQLRNPRTVVELTELLYQGPVDAEAVVLEITETALVLGVEEAVDALQSLKATGARIALDDFGTGQSSLSTLAGLPIDLLKIDRAFVSGQADGVPSEPVLQTVLALAGNLDLVVVAEGIEQPAQTRVLTSLGCTLGQGFGLARPAPAEAITSLVLKGALPDVAGLER